MAILDIQLKQQLFLLFIGFFTAMNDEQNDKKEALKNRDIASAIDKKCLSTS